MYAQINFNYEIYYLHKIWKYEKKNDDKHLINNKELNLENNYGKYEIKHINISNQKLMILCSDKLINEHYLIPLIISIQNA